MWPCGAHLQVVRDDGLTETCSEDSVSLALNKGKLGQPLVHTP